MLDKGFPFQPAVCNGCHDILIIPFSISNAAILNNSHTGYHCIIIYISKSEAAINLLKNANLSEKSDRYKISKISIFFLSSL